MESMLLDSSKSNFFPAVGLPDVGAADKGANFGEVVDVLESDTTTTLEFQRWVRPN